MLANILGETQYGNYKEALISNGAGANIVTCFSYVCTCSIVIFRKGIILEGKEKYYNIIVNFSVINLIAILLATKFWIYARFNMYFSVVYGCIIEYGVLDIYLMKKMKN